MAEKLIQYLGRHALCQSELNIRPGREGVISEHPVDFCFRLAETGGAEDRYS
jgi:hypothetical protein